MTRTFEDRPAVRERTPLLVGLVGPSGVGKTFSALRLATGIQRVSGGDVFVVDTEARRALHYADRFKFRHVPFDPPFGPLDYLAVIGHCTKRGAGVIVVDSMSMEHEGPGGVLEMHEQEVVRLMESGGFKSEFAANIPAWAKPKAERRKLINGVLQLGCNLILCFRAKEKIKIVDRKPVPQGWCPIAGEEFIYEMTAKCVLLPGADGSPSWTSDEPGERAMMKLPEQFREVFAKPGQLSEDIGQRLAEWAAGKDPVGELVAQYAAATGRGELDAAEAYRAEMWKRIDAPAKQRLKDAAEAAKKRLAPPPVERDEDGNPVLFAPGNDNAAR